jgi:hypothetical protein
MYSYENLVSNFQFYPINSQIILESKIANHNLNQMGNCRSCNGQRYIYSNIRYIYDSYNRYKGFTSGSKRICSDCNGTGSAPPSLFGFIGFLIAIGANIAVVAICVLFML